MDYKIIVIAIAAVIIFNYLYNDLVSLRKEVGALETIVTRVVDRDDPRTNIVIPPQSCNKMPMQPTGVMPQITSNAEYRSRQNIVSPSKKTVTDDPSFEIDRMMVWRNTSRDHEQDQGLYHDNEPLRNPENADYEEEQEDVSITSWKFPKEYEEDKQSSKDSSSITIKSYQVEKKPVVIVKTKGGRAGKRCNIRINTTEESDDNDEVVAKLSSKMKIHDAPRKYQRSKINMGEIHIGATDISERVLSELNRVMHQDVEVVMMSSSDDPNSDATSVKMRRNKAHKPGRVCINTAAASTSSF